MVEVHICGKSYPLCLTVAALDEITARCGGLNNVGNLLDGREPQYVIAPEGDDGAAPKANMAGMAINTAWLLAVLIREGESNRRLVARLNGEEIEPRSLPDHQDLVHLLTIASAMKYRTAVFQAIHESMSKEIEAVYPKNAEGAEQE